MSKRCPKIRERKDSRFSPGCLGPLLLPLLFILVQISRSPIRSEWIGQAVGLESLNPNVLTAIVAGLATLLAGVMVWLVKRHRKKLQALRDAEIFLPGPRALFLRPYFSDTKVKLLNPFFSSWAAAFSGVPVNFDGGILLPEQFVGRVLEPFINVVQVGGSPAISNATLTVTDKEWKPAVAEAVDAAAVVIVMPILREDRRTGHTAGVSTILELQYLVESTHLSRTIIVMPDAMWHSRRRIARGWEQARQKAAKFSLLLPPYNKKGAVMTFEKTEGGWQVSRTFGQGICRRRKIAFGLVEAVTWLAQRHSFSLLDR